MGQGEVGRAGLCRTKWEICEKELVWSKEGNKFKSRSAQILQGNPLGTLQQLIGKELGNCGWTGARLTMEILESPSIKISIFPTFRIVIHS